MSNMRELINIYERWETESTTLSVEFPLVMNFPKSMLIGTEAKNLSRLFNVDIKSKQLKKGAVGEPPHGMLNLLYWGVFWVGKSPTTTVVKALLDKAGWTIWQSPYGDDD